MQYSTNNRLKLPEGTDNVRRQDFVDNFNIIDNGLTKFYVATLDSINTYKITTGNSLTALNNGYSIKIAIPSDSSGAVSVKVDSVTVPVKKPNGSAVTNFKQNGVYSLTYYNSVFILASGGMDDVNFSASDLLTGKSANDSNGEKVNGTMPNKGAITASINCGGSYTIPAGYHNGSGKVTANSLASQTSANATAGDILKNKTAWVNGSKITGAMPNLSADTPIQHESNNSTKVIQADGAFIGNNTDGVRRIGFRYNGADGYITRNTLFGYPMSALMNDLGITADKIVAGNTIGGISGTATVGTMAKYVEADLSAVNVYTNADGTEEFKITTGFKPRFAMVNYFHSEYNKTILVLFNYTENKWYGIGRKYNHSSTTTYDTSHVITVISFENDGVIVKASPYYRSKVSWIISQ